MNQPNTADEAVTTRLIALTYMEALISGDTDLADMVTSGISDEELLRSMEDLSQSLIAIISHKIGNSRLDVIAALRESSLRVLKEKHKNDFSE
jgi:hypothetical protein